MAAIRQALDNGRWKCQPFAAAVVLLSLVLIGSVWGVVLWRLDSQRAEAIAHQIRLNSNLAIAVEQHAISALKGIDLALFDVGAQFQREGNRLNIHQLIDSGEVDGSLFNYLAIIDASGKLVLSSIAFRQTNLAARKFFRRHRQQDSHRVYIGRPRVGRFTGKWSFQLSRRISKPGGAFAGVVLAGVNPDYFIDFYRQLDLGEHDRVSLVGLDGITRARHAGQEDTGGDYVGNTALFAEQARKPVGHFLAPGGRGGMPELVSYRRLRHYPLLAVVATSEAEALAAYAERSHNYYNAGALISGLIAILAATLIIAWSRQKRITEALARSEARYRATFDQAPIGIAHTSTDGRYLEANAGVSEILGYLREELDTLTIHNIYHPEDLPQVLEDRRQLVAGERQTVLRELRYVRRDRSVGWAYCSASLVRDAAGRADYFVALIQDITAHKQVETALRLSEERLHGIVASALQGVVTVDQQRRIVTFNPAAEEMFGYRAAEVMNLPADFLVPPRLAADYLANMNVLLTGNYDQDTYPKSRMTALRKEGSELRLEASFARHTSEAGALVTFVLSDVTPQLAAERRLRQLSTAVEQSPVAIVITDLAGNIEYVNPRFVEQSGYSFEEVRGRNPRLMKSGETPAAEYQRLWQSISGGREWAGELHNRKKNGELLWEFVRIMPVISDKGVIINYMAVKEDITQRKASELRERIEQEQILHNARLIDMGEMAAALAHELNQPLTAIVNYAGVVERLLTTDAPDRQRLQQILTYIKEDALRGGKILWWMRDFVRKREPQREPADLNGVVRSVVRLAQISARASDVSIEMVFAEEISELPIDRVQIEQVLFNLIGNGIEAMGSVAGERRLEIATRLVEEANELRVSVRDHGCGLPDRIAMDVFSPFFTTKPGGMGLGLSICRGIVEAHGGRIWAVPNDHGGTTFSFSLPLARQLT